MADVQLGSPLPLAALGAAVVGVGFVIAVQAYRRGRNPRKYEPALAWLRAGAYFSFAWALGLLTGALSTIVDNPIVFPGQPSSAWWWLFTLVALAVVFVGYWVIWPIGTRAHGRTLVMPETPVFGLLWGVSEGLIFASVWTTAVRVFGRDDTWQRIAVFASCYVVLSLFIGLWHAVYWDIYIAPEHNVLEWNIRKVILCHNPNVIVTTAYVTVFGNLTVYVGLQAFALFGATLAMPFPSFRVPNPEVDPDNAPRRDLHGLVCVLTGVGSRTVADVATDLAELGATLVLVTDDTQAAEELRVRVRAWTGNDDIGVLRSGLSSPADARQVAAELAKGWGRVDVLVDDWSGADRSGDPGALVARHRGGVALQRELARLADPTRPLRIVVVGAEDHRGVDGAQLAAVLAGEGSVDLATLSAVRVGSASALAAELDPASVTVQTLASGVMVGNSTAEPSGAAAFFSTIFQSNLDPALTYVHLVRTDRPEPVTGGYWTNCEPGEPSEVLADPALRAGLLAWSVSGA